MFDLIRNPSSHVDPESDGVDFVPPMQATYAAEDLWHVQALERRAARMRGASAAPSPDAAIGKLADDSEPFQDDIDAPMLPASGKDGNFTDDGGVGYRCAFIT